MMLVGSPGRVFRVWIGAFFAAWVAVCCWPACSQAAVIRLDSTRKYQRITAWEATSYASQDDPAFPKVADQLLSLTVNDLGINRVRLEVRSGAENQDFYTKYTTGQIDYATWRANRYATVNDNADPFSINWAGFHFTDLDNKIEKLILPLRQKMAARGQKLLINLNYVAFTGQIGSGLAYHHDDSPEEYAELVEVTYLHMRDKYGFVPDAWEVILEPDNTSFWRGKPIGQAIVASANRLKKHGFTPRFIAPSTTNMANAPSYFDTMKQQVPEAVQYIEELSYHRYSGVSDVTLRGIAERAGASKINTSMLEHIGSGHADLHNDLKLGNVSSWAQYTLAGTGTNDDGGKYYLINTSDPANPKVIAGDRTRYLRQYMHYIHPGAQRIDAATDNAGFDPVAFINPDGQQVVVIKTSSGGPILIDNLPAGRYEVSYTTSSATNVSYPDITLAPNQRLSTGIPAAGVLTITGVPEPTALSLLGLGCLRLLSRRR